VPDASIDTWLLVWALAQGARAHGARVLPYHEAITIHRDGDRVRGAGLRNNLTGEQVDVEARITVSASGAWAGRIAEMAGIEGVHVLPGRGIMIAMNHRLVNTVVNRCQMPTDGDIIVPIRTVSVIGTTDVHTDDPDDHTVLQNEVDAMLDDGEKLVPGFKQSRALRVWTGVRPLFEDRKGGESGSTRDVTRAHAMLDHRERDGVDGFLTITGGKLTTYRLMAQDTVDAVCKQLGEDRRCTTDTEPLPGSESGEYLNINERLGRREQSLQDDQLVCECELIPRSRLEDSARRRGSFDLDDMRRQLRLGMGPCQGGFCIYRAAGILHSLDGINSAEASSVLLSFLRERWKGVWPILYGDQVRQARLDDWIFQGILDVNHLPS
jgi:glycerol-3-phosphate dehydrogenase